MKAILSAVLLCFSSMAFAWDLPDPIATPGVTNPAITPSNYRNTLCNKAWSTRSIRPSVSYTNALKLRQLSKPPYKSALDPSAFEEDHLISLELGGNPKDPHNLFPQHWSDPWGARMKDHLENYLHAQVCLGKITLTDAQHEISTNWIASYKQHLGKE